MSLLILVVDDEPDVEALFRQQFRRDLRDNRFKMDFAQSAASALRRISDAAGKSLILILSALPPSQRQSPTTQNLIANAANARPSQRPQASPTATSGMLLRGRDINMPGMSGLELLPKAKAARPDVAVIMIRAYGDPDTRRKALEGGAESLLTKPIDFVALRSEIDSRVAGAGAEVR